MESTVFRAGLLDGQVAIVSGGGSGIGRATALELAALGARVVVCGRRAEPLDAVAAGAPSGRIDARPCKVVSITLSPHHGLPGMAHSSAARAAVENLMRVLSVEWARHGIRLNAIAAGQIATETLRTKYPRPLVESMAQTIPLGRLGRPEEIAWLVACLTSPAGDFVSGAVLTVDGARDDWLGRWSLAGAADAHGRPLAEERRRPE